MSSWICNKKNRNHIKFNGKQLTTNGISNIIWHSCRKSLVECWLVKSHLFNN